MRNFDPFNPFGSILALQRRPAWNTGQVFREGAYGMWLDFTLPNSIYSDAGITLTQPGDAIYQVNDLSGNAVPSGQPNPSQRPTHARVPSVRQNRLVATNDQLDDTNWGANTNGFTVTSAIPYFEGHNAWRMVHQGQGVSKQRLQQFGDLVVGQQTLTVIVENVDAAETVYGVRDVTTGTWLGLSRFTWADEAQSIYVGAGATAIEDLGVGPNGGPLRRISLTVTAANTNPGEVLFAPTGTGANTLGIVLHHIQLESGPAFSSPQFVRSEFDILDLNQPSFNYGRWDGDDDRYAITFPQAFEGEIFYAGRAGCFVETGVSIAQGRQRVIGSFGSLRFPNLVEDVGGATGDISAVVALDRSFTPAEINQLVEYYQARGAGGSTLSLTPATAFTAYYDATRTGVLWQDEAGTVPVTEAGQSVARADDLSGNGHHATQPDAAKRPTYGTHAGLPALLFTTAQQLELPAGVVAGTSFCMVMAMSKTTERTAQTARYGEFWKTVNNNFGIWTDNRNDRLTMKQARVSGSDSRITVEGFHNTVAVGDTALLTVESSIGHGRIRMDMFPESDAAETGTALDGMNDASIIGYNMPFALHGFGVIDDYAGWEERYDLEEALQTVLGKTAPWTPTTIAHRGFYGCNPENTLKAYTEALNEGFRLLDMDIQPSADGTLWCFHDDNVDNTTNGTGVFTQLTDAYIETLLIDGEPLLKLADLLALLATYPDAEMVFEMKETGGDLNTFISTLTTLINTAGVASQMHGSSFTSGEVDALKAAIPAMKCSTIGGKSTNVFATVDANKLKGYGFIPHRSSLSQASVDYAKAEGVDLYVYSITDNGQYRQVADYGEGVTAVFISRPLGQLGKGICYTPAAA